MLLYRVTENPRSDSEAQKYTGYSWEHSRNRTNTVLGTIMFITDSYLYNPLLWITEMGPSKTYTNEKAWKHQELNKLQQWNLPSDVLLPSCSSASPADHFLTGKEYKSILQFTHPPLSDLQVKETHLGWSPSHSSYKKKR